MAQDNKNAVSSMLPPTEETTATSKPPPPLPTIPFDLVVEILCRLPVKSLLQLRCVCKSWKTLISDPEFAKTHLRCSPKDFTCHHTMANLRSYRSRALMVYPLQSVFNAAAVTTPATATRVKYPLNDQNRFNFIAGSCHGMLLLDIDESSPILWNPSTRRFKKLPSLENPLLEEEDCECYTTYGFGYDHSTDRYKVVAVFCLKCDDDDDDEVYYETQVKVHTLGTDSWRSIEDFGSGDPGNESGKFVSGTLNWLLSDDLVIVSFDLGNESYQEHCLPVCGGVVWGYLEIACASLLIMMIMRLVIFGL
ncbi:F-box/kelch-repeat protein At3g23880-like [Lotus japonicus]|uniref:F-box/kelch-repeat protein At3g23880-like n=1 Tax=Lotus japonicus TaxID=34305 RepID=UPI00258A830E|nr:F-box/kelch-repeat protein At3g23880-like [Lotus japonicus]